MCLPENKNIHFSKIYMIRTQNEHTLFQKH